MKTLKVKKTEIVGILNKSRSSLHLKNYVSFFYAEQNILVYSKNCYHQSIR